MLTRLPGFTDLHVHFREPGATYKEDWGSGTAAALAGGFTTVLAMPNTLPPISDAHSLQIALNAAMSQARCDYGQFIGGDPNNSATLASLAVQVAGLKLYLDPTFGDLKLDTIDQWMPHFSSWPTTVPLAAHAEGTTLAAAILLAAMYDRPLHLCHVSRKDEILLIRDAKEKGFKITCEVCPHHLFLSENDVSSLGPGRAEVRPRLASLADQEALWANLDVIDCFATDHAPHTLEEKDSPIPPPGFPGLETILPLMLTAVKQGRLELEDLVARLHHNPRRIFGIPDQPETFIEVDLEDKFELSAKHQQTRCGWTPFEGWKVHGRVRRVVLRGLPAYEDGKVKALPGNGRNIRP